jgi:hypothetical protein
MPPVVAACLALLVATAALVPHAHVDREAALALLRRWQPKLAAGQMLSVAGVEAFARARIALQDAGASAVVAEDLTLFVVTNTLDPRGVHLATALFRHDEEVAQVRALRDLRHWAAHRRLDFVVGPVLAAQWERAGREL